MKTVDDRYDCVVIGAGMAGLAFACLAAADGKRVLVVDQHYLPGGSFTSFKNGAYLFNVALEWTTGCAPGEGFHSLLSELGVQNDYPFERVDIFKSIISPELEKPIDLHTRADRFRKDLVDSFPEQALEIDRFLDDCIALVSNTARSKSILMNHGVKPVEKMLNGYFTDPLLIHLLYSLIAYPGAVGVLLMYMVAAICSDEMWRPVHRDHRKLASLLQRRIIKLGGKVALSTKVKRVLVENNIAYGIELADGQRIFCSQVVATTDPQQLYSRLLVPDAGSSSLVRGVLAREPGLSCFCVFLGLNRNTDGLAPRQSAYSLLADSLQWKASPVDLAGIPLRMEIQSAHYPKLAPAGHSTLCAWAAMPISAFDYWGQGGERDLADLDVQRYKEAKHMAMEAVLTRLESAMPGLRKSIEVVDAATPYTFKRYTCARAGSVSGHSLASISYLKTASNQTHIEGLYHIGHWTTQSGVNMVMYSARTLYDSLFKAVPGVPEHLAVL